MKKLEDMTEPELKLLMNEVCRGIEATAARLGVEKPLFCIVLFNDPQIAKYAGNCVREDMIKSMRETADRLERKQDVER